MSQKLNDACQRCVVIDTETTGLDPQLDRVIELALLVVKSGRIVDRFHSRIDPLQHIPSGASAIHGITDKMLSGQPRFSDVATPLLGFAQERVVVGHNIAFDLGFIQAEIARSVSDSGIEVPEEISSLCTAEAARDLIPRSHVGRYSLRNLARYLGLDTHPEHRAMADAESTFELLARLSTVAKDYS